MQIYAKLINELIQIVSEFAISIINSKYLLKLRMSISGHVRSAGTFLLEEPRTRTVVASRAFSSAGPKVWNSLDVETRKQKSFDAFKMELKTF